MNKIETLTHDWGYVDPITLAEDYAFDGVAPAICQNPDCDYSTEMEPDQDRGWCECCATNTVASIYVMMGMI